MTIRIVVADDQAMVRTGFAAVLNAQPDLEVVGDAENGRHAVSVARATRPDIVLMDVRMPEMNGLDAARELLGAAADTQELKVIMLTTFDLDDYVYEALRLGASGFLLKDAPINELIHAVRVVAAGDALLAPSVTRRLIADFARVRPAEPRPGVAGRLGPLTPRETEVLALIARGLSNREIADRLVVAEQTVKTHRPHPRQARSARPGPRRRARLRVRPGRAGRSGLSRHDLGDQARLGAIQAIRPDSARRSGPSARAATG